MFNSLNHYPHICIINNNSNDVLNKLHEIGTFFIDVSYNARISQHFLRAVTNGSIPIVLDTYYIVDDLFAVSGNDDIPIYVNRPISELYSGEFTWRVPNMGHLREKLKFLYNNNYYQNDRVEQSLFKLKKKINAGPEGLKECLL